MSPNLEQCDMMDIWKNLCFSGSLTDIRGGVASAQPEVMFVDTEFSYPMEMTILKK